MKGARLGPAVVGAAGEDVAESGFSLCGYQVVFFFSFGEESPIPSIPLPPALLSLSHPLIPFPFLLILRLSLSRPLTRSPLLSPFSRCLSYTLSHSRPRPSTRSFRPRPHTHSPRPSPPVFSTSFVTAPRPPQHLFVHSFSSLFPRFLFSSSNSCNFHARAIVGSHDCSPQGEGEREVDWGRGRKERTARERYKFVLRRRGSDLDSATAKKDDDCVCQRRHSQ